MAKKKAVKKTAIKKGSAAAKAKMAKVRKAKKNYILVEADRQTKVKTTNSGGYLYPYNKTKDAQKKAMPPGKRISKKTNNPYWEYRVNRSDKKGSLTGEFTISGLNSKRDLLDKVYKNLAMAELSLLSYKNALKNYKLDTLTKNKYNKEIKFINKTINQYKKNIALLKK